MAFTGRPGLQPPAPTPGDRKCPFYVGRQTWVSVLSVRLLPISGSQVEVFHSCGPGTPTPAKWAIVWAQPHHTVQEQVGLKAPWSRNKDYTRGWVLWRPEALAGSAMHRRCPVRAEGTALEWGLKAGLGQDWTPLQNVLPVMGPFWKVTGGWPWQDPLTLNWTQGLRETLSPILRPKPTPWEDFAG